MAITSNPVTITVTGTQPPPSGYTVSVSANPSTNLSTNTYVTFTVTVTSSSGSIPTGNAILYLAHASSTVWGQWSLTLNNGSASVTLQPGLYLASGESSMNYYAVYSGVQSQINQITFQTSVEPTSITLSASTTSPSPNTIVTFTVQTNGSNVAGTLYAYNSQSNAQNAPSLTGQLAQYPLTVGTSGTGTVGNLYPTQLANTTYWIAVIDNVQSNIVTVTGQTVAITSMTMCGTATGYQGDVEFNVTTNSGGEGTANLTGYSYDPSTNTVGSIVWGPEAFLQIVNGTGNVTIVPGMVRSNTAWQASINGVTSNYVYVTNASSSSPGTVKPTC